MASGEKVIQLSHNKLQNLARKHDDKDVVADGRNENRGHQRSKKAQKKPDAEIYRPGNSRRTKRNDTDTSAVSDPTSPDVDSIEGRLADVDIADPGDSGAWNSSRGTFHGEDGTRKTSTSRQKEHSPNGGHRDRGFRGKEQSLTERADRPRREKQQSEMDIAEKSPRRHQKEQSLSDVEERSLRKSQKEESPSDVGPRNQKRRQKRPDLQRYVPRPRQHQHEDPASKLESSDRRTQEGGASSGGGGARGQGGGARGPRGGAGTIEGGVKRTEEQDFNSRSVSVKGDQQNNIVITVRNDDDLSSQHPDTQRAGLTGRRRQPRKWQEHGAAKNNSRQRSSDSTGSVEFLDDGLEWDYQVDIDAEPKGEEDDDDAGADFDIAGHFEVGLLACPLEEYEGLPSRPPMQGLLGIDTFDTLRDLDISLSGEELFDDISREKRRKPGSARRKRTPQWREKLKLKQDMLLDGDSPRSNESDTPDSARLDQLTLTTKVPPLNTVKTDQQIEASQTKQDVDEREVFEREEVSPAPIVVAKGESEDPIEVDARNDKNYSNDRSSRGRGHSYKDQRPILSPKEQRRNDRRVGRNKGRSEGNGEQQQKQDHARNQDQRKLELRDPDNSVTKQHIAEGAKKSGDTRRRGRKENDSKGNNERKSVEKDTADQTSSTGSKYIEIKSKGKGNKGNGKEETKKKSGLGWADRVELGDEEIDYEHEVLDFGSESSSQSSILVKVNNLPTPDSDKATPEIDKYVDCLADDAAKSRRGDEVGHSRGRGRGRHRNAVEEESRPSRKSPVKEKVSQGKESNRDHVHYDEFSENRNNRKSPVKEKLKGKEANSNIAHSKGGEGKNSTIKERPKVTEYDIEGDNFDGLVITNSSFNNSRGGKDSPRKRHTSGEATCSGDRRRVESYEDKNKFKPPQRRGSHDPGGSYDRNRGSYTDQRGEGSRNRGFNDRSHDQRMRRSPEGEGHHLQQENAKKQQRGFAKDHRQDRRHSSERHSTSERHRTVSHSSTDSAPPSSAKGGGILHLPASTTASSELHGLKAGADSSASQHLHQRGKMTSQPHYHPQQHQHHHGNDSSNNNKQISERGRGRGRGRGNTHRTLYDPNNPQPRTPAMHPPQNGDNIVLAASPPVGDDQHHVTKPLHFHDSGEESPSSGGIGGHSPSFPPFPGSGPVYRGHPPPIGFMRGGGVRQPMGFIPPPQLMLGRPPHVQGGYPRQPRVPGFYPQEFYNHDMNFGHPSLGEDESIQLYNFEGSETNRGKTRSEKKDKAEGLMRAVGAMESQLSGLLAKRIHGMEDFTRIMSLKKEFQLKCLEVMLLDPETSTQNSVEQLMWKTAFYQLIEIIRKEMHTGESWEPNMLRQSLMGVLDEGDTFYDRLLQELQSSFGFRLEQFYDSLKPYPSHLGRSAKLALYIAHISLLCLGDLARYREQINQMANYGKARSCYMKAQQVMPKNGRPYNQLAILAMYTKRKLEAVYYFMRSLAASNPFVNGREILMSIFDEIRKKAEVVEQKRLTEKAKHHKKPKRKCHSHRLEIWFHPDGSSSEDRIEEDDEDDALSRLSGAELNKRFTLSFLNVHGKLFTKIGMESFPETSSSMLHELQALLEVSPSALSVARLQQLVTVNMFAVHNVLPKDQSHLDENCRPLLQEYAVQLGLDMFAVIAQRCLHLLKEHLNSGEPQLFSKEVEELTPSLILWGNWMTVHVDLWSPPPLPRDPELGPVIDVWQITAELINLLSAMEISHIKLYKQPIDGCELLILPEASQMAGFVPLNLCSEDDRYVHSTVDKVTARNYLRLEKLKTLADVLAGIDEPLLRWSGERHRYEAVLKEIMTDSAEQQAQQFRKESESEDVVIESESEDEVNVSGETEEIRELKAKKEDLERQVAQKARHEENIQAMIEDQQNTRVELEVHPTFLIPDTNCFIDHLPILSKLLLAKKYTVIVPLIVITELDGLSKGSKEGQYDSFEHAEKVKKGAQSTVEFLEEAFEARHSHLRAITSKGNVMETIAFRSEEAGQGGNNDDMILSCCLHYCQDKARDFMPKDRDEPIRLYREAVLLTDDRNLRLKAHTRNVPAKEVLKFFRWAKIG